MTTPSQRARQVMKEYMEKLYPPLSPGPDYNDSQWQPQLPPDPEALKITDDLLKIDPYEYDPIPSWKDQKPKLYVVPLYNDLFEFTEHAQRRQEEKLKRDSVNIPKDIVYLGSDATPAQKEKFEKWKELRDNFFVDQNKDKTRMELQYDLESTAQDIVQCDKYYCDDLAHLWSDMVLTYAHIHDKSRYEGYTQCMSDQLEYWEKQGINWRDPNIAQQQPDNCRGRLQALHTRFEPRVALLIEEERMKTYNRPLLHYDGRSYDDPRWFWHVGTLWRTFYHQPYNNPYINIGACEELQEMADRCIKDMTEPDGRCFRYWAQSRMCVPGANCPYLRPPLMQCLDEEYLKQHDMYNAEKCFQSIPNFVGCQEKYVPIDFVALGVESIKAEQRGRASEQPPIDDGVRQETLDENIKEYHDEDHNYSPRYYNNFNTYIPPLKYKPKKRGSGYVPRFPDEEYLKAQEEKKEAKRKKKEERELRIEKARQRIREREAEQERAKEVAARAQRLPSALELAKAVETK